MKRKFFIFIGGTLLFAPSYIFACMESLALNLFALVWIVLLWHSPKFSPKVRKFWRNFWKVQMELLNEVR